MCCWRSPTHDGASKATSAKIYEAKPEKRHPLVIVEWADAYSGNPGWLTVDEWVRGPGSRPEWINENIGYLIRETKDAVVLAARHSGPDQVNREFQYQYGLFQLIPRGMVRRIIRVRAPRRR